MFNGFLRLLGGCIYLLSTSMLVYAQSTVVQQVVIGPAGGPSNWAFGPIYRNTGNAGLLNFSRHAYIYTASELGIPSGAKIIALEWLKKDNATITGNNEFNIWMSNTSLSSFSGNTAWGSLVPGMTKVLSSTTYAVTGAANTYMLAQLSDSLVYNGGNLMILTDWTKLGFASAAVPFYVSTATGKSLGIVSSTALTNTSTLQTSIYGNSRPTIRISYVPVPPCQGTPNPGNTLSTLTSVCPGVPFNLSLQYEVPGAQVTYQWQRANNATFTQNLTNLGTGSSQTLTQSTAFYYRCAVSCGASGVIGYSTPLLVNMAPSYGCYCPSSALSDADEEIIKFSFGSMRNCSNCQTTAPGPNSVLNLYSNYQLLNPVTVQQGSSVPFSIEVGVCSYNNYPNRCAVFIDYNQNNSFSDPGELVYSSATAVNGAHTESGIIVIPNNALTGLTGLRVINSEQGGPITNPCLMYPWGETEDYVISIIPANNCSGQPNPGNTIIDLNGSCTPASGSFAICQGQTKVISLQNPGLESDFSYQWKKNGVWIAGATQKTYTPNPILEPVSFSCEVTCLNSGLITESTPIFITLESFLQCYCSSKAAGNTDEDIFNVSLNGSTLSSDCITTAPGPGSILNQYSNFTTLSPLATLTIGGSAPFSLFVDDCDVPPAPYYNFATSIWIDFNQNGSFNDPGEQVFIEPLALQTPRTVQGNMLIPCTAKPGITRMRISVVEGLSGSQISPCMTYGFGETEDYHVNLTLPTSPCTLPIPAPGLTQASAVLLCDSTEVLLSLQNKCLLSNYNYQWYKDGLPIAGATSYTFNTPRIFENSSFYCRVSCGTQFVNSTPITLSTSNIQDVTLTASTFTYCMGGSNPIALLSSSASNLNYTYEPPVGLSSATGSSVLATPPATLTYTVTGTDGNGCTRTSAITLQVVSCNIALNLKLLIQGYYAGNGQMFPVRYQQGTSTNLNLTDSIDVDIRAANSPYQLITSKRVGLSVDGNALINFPALGGQYYIVIRHRNALTTWSAVPVNINTGSYDFTNQAGKAFGNNQVEVEPGKWAFYSGDLIKDENIDLVDLNLLDIDINLFASGDTATDINGDGNVDLLDSGPIEGNVYNFIYTMKP